MISPNQDNGGPDSPWLFYAVSWQAKNATDCPACTASANNLACRFCYPYKGRCRQPNTDRDKTGDYQETFGVLPQQVRLGD